jgi:NAD(P)H-dependent flavin oxidoreductase YrpB (nitropropane dioxygenase family)
MGTRFAATQESSTSPNIKQRYVEATETDTVLWLPLLEQT